MVPSVAMYFCIFWLAAEEPFRAIEKNKILCYFISLKPGFSRFMNISTQYCNSRMLNPIIMCETFWSVCGKNEFALCDTNNNFVHVLYQTSIP